MVQSQAAMRFINFQAVKKTCTKSKLSSCKTVAKYKVVSKIIFQSQAAMSLINCQGEKKVSKKYFQEFDIFKSYGV
jgi:hypothetical protein